MSGCIRINNFYRKVVLDFHIGISTLTSAASFVCKIGILGRESSQNANFAREERRNALLRSRQAKRR
jgi:hypothetical protein